MVTQSSLFSISSSCRRPNQPSPAGPPSNKHTTHSTTISIISKPFNHDIPLPLPIPSNLHILKEKARLPRQRRLRHGRRHVYLGAAVRQVAALLAALLDGDDAHRLEAGGALQAGDHGLRTFAGQFPVYNGGWGMKK